MFVIKQDSKPNHKFAEQLLLKRMERGIRINPKIAEVGQELQDNYKKLSDIIKSYKINNPNSNPQIKNAFNKILKEEDLEVTFIKDKQSFCKEVLYKLESLGYELASALLKYREQKKLIESIDGLLTKQDINGLIYPDISIGKTNRFNYINPALMNIPKALLWKSIAPYHKDSSLYSVDIKQQEPWIIINMLDIKSLKDLVKKYQDFYKAVFFAIFDDDITNDKQRDEIKTAWNAMAYGAGKQTIIDSCFHIDGETVYKYFSTIPEYKEYKSKAYSASKRDQQEVETLFGTKLYADEHGSQSALARVLMDIPVQGTASDILVLLIENFMYKVEKNKMEDLIDIYYTRHDELIIEASNKLSEQEVNDYLQKYLEHKVENWEAFKINIKKVA